MAWETDAHFRRYGVFTELTLGAGTARAADLTVGANIGNVPWEFQDASGKSVGFEVDLVNEATAENCQKSLKSL